MHEVPKTLNDSSNVKTPVQFIKTWVETMLISYSF